MIGQNGTHASHAERYLEQASRIALAVGPGVGPRFDRVGNQDVVRHALRGRATMTTFATGTTTARAAVPVVAGSPVIASILGTMSAAVACEYDGNNPVEPEKVLKKLSDVEKRAHYT